MYLLIDGKHFEIVEDEYRTKMHKTRVALNMIMWNLIADTLR